MTVSVVIAYRDMGDEARRRAMHYVLAWYARLDWEIVVEAGASDATFTRASAINTAVRRARGDVILQVDPDSLVHLDAAQTAAAFAHEDGLVVAHDVYLYLTEQATELVLTGQRDPMQSILLDCHDHGARGSGNVVAFNRSTWERAGGFDERFGLWGGDDAAFRYAAEAITGAPTRRVPGPMVHLWHPRLPQSIPGDPGYQQQFQILAKYRDAAQVGPDAVRALVASR